MKKSTKIMAGVIAALLTLGVAGCNKNTVYPDFRNPEHVEETSEKYVINVLSEGGLKLDGIKVTASRAGTPIKTSISADGVIELALTLGEYVLTVDESSLPAGYYLPEGFDAGKTNPDKRDEVTIKIPSKLVETASSSYNAGQIMSDFTFKDADGMDHKLSDSLKNKKAVVINFFYTGCAPCRREFPAIQEAYSAFSDKVDIYAVCSTHQGDTNEKVREFKNSNRLSFPMGVDTLGLISAFGVNNFPTTVVIDRYGLIAYRTMGGEPSVSFWKGLFNEFSADNYKQSLSSSGTDDGPTEGEQDIPNIDMPNSEVLEAAANGGNITATYAPDDDTYAWPWLADGKNYIYSSNKGLNNSYSIVHCLVEMHAGDVLSFEYNVSSEEGCDILYAFVDGQIVDADGWSATKGWQSADVYVADMDRGVDLSFLYMKDAQDLNEEAVGEDVAKIRNIHIGTVNGPMDVMRPAVSGMNDDRTFTHYANVKYNESDGYYHCVNEDGSIGSILYMSLIQPTVWTDAHIGKKTTTLTDGTTYYNTIYYMTYYMYRTGEGTNVKFVFNNDNGALTNAIIEANRVQTFMQGPYYLIPVTREMQEWMVAFCSQYAKDNGKLTYEKEWLEMCYYFDHYGGFNETFKTSQADTDPTVAMRPGNAYIAYEATDPALAASPTKGMSEGSNRLVQTTAMQTFRGLYFKFTATQTGIYEIRSMLHNYSSDEEDDGNKSSSRDAWPEMWVIDENGRETLYVDDVRDQDFLKGRLLEDDSLSFVSEKYSSYDFKTYLPLREGETIYLRLSCGFDNKGYFDFNIKYLGESVTRLLTCVTDRGLWESEGRVSAIETRYVDSEDRYYALLDDASDYDPNGSVYVDFTSYNYMIYGAKGSQPLKNYIVNADGTSTNYFKKYDLPLASTWRNAQELMEYYLAQAEANGGKVLANKELVNILQQLVNDICEGGGEGNGWLMFACYDKTFRIN